MLYATPRRYESLGSQTNLEPRIHSLVQFVEIKNEDNSTSDEKKSVRPVYFEAKRKQARNENWVLILGEFENFRCLLLTGSLLKLKDVTSDFMGVSEHVRLK